MQSFIRPFLERLQVLYYSENMLMPRLTYGIPCTGVLHVSKRMVLLRPTCENFAAMSPPPLVFIFVL